ncbi:Ig-like domain-containing protein [Oharaeibacter diazotrophicus]|uniref:Ig-like domain-containing protein n=1 Tax=Oharaeibacter diazotrophicus TaxID=1920512 RepID=A0A4R6RFK6_9HYPH|nr:Ig-like domain-containing protein [Oharaeibacter diazotrophicus]TDP85119.1 Ig-like domain-containing protein [Oharaeibacter diazotrophicus]BBE74089.1 hypothetical protein OHA_1_03716 [Pleomorphomonas sp. SM30]GLS76223.1 hypothetical protein GCM10007904_15580 [Oharaeibacter diazotrophicus]
MSIFHGRTHFAAAVLAGLAFAPAGTALAADTVTKLAVSPAKAVYGQPVTFTATVTEKGGTTPVSGGTVEFKRGGVSLGSAAVVDGKATLVVATPATGAASATAAFGGSGDDKASTSKATALLVSFAKTTTALTLSDYTIHTKTNFNAMVEVGAVAPSVAVPAGSVQFKLGTKVVGTVPLDENGRAVLQLQVPLPVPYQMVATYKPTAKLGFQASTSKKVAFQGTYAVSDEVELGKGNNVTYATAKNASGVMVVWAKQNAQFKTDLKTCLLLSEAAPTTTGCVATTTIDARNFKDLVATAAVNVGLGVSGLVVAGVIIDPVTKASSVWVGYIGVDGKLVASTTLTGPGLGVLAPSVTSLYNGDVVLTYSAIDATGASTVNAKVFQIETKSLRAVGDPVVVATSTARVLSTSVATDYSTAIKGFSVGWVVDTSVAYIRRYNASAIAMGAAKPINPVAKQNLTQLDLEGVVQPTGVIATWTEEATGAAAPTDVRARRYDVAGNGLAITGAATDPKGAQSQSYSDVLVQLGGWGTVWASPDAFLTGVYGKLFDKTGKATSPEFPLNVTTAGIQKEPKLASGALSRDFFGFWLNQNADNSTSLIARRFKP